MQPQDDQASPPVSSDDAAPSGPPSQPKHAASETAVALEPAAAAKPAEPGAGPDRPAKRPVIPIAAFGHVPVRWLVVAGGVLLLVVVALAVVPLTGPSKPTAAPSPNNAGTNATGTSGPGAPGGASASPGSSAAPGSPGSAGGGAAGAPGSGPANGGNPGTPPASVDALRALLIDPPTADSTVDLSGADDTAIEGARWGASLFWTNPVGSMVLTQFGTADQARAALGQYRAGIHDTGICTESTMAGRADAFLCTPKDVGEGVNPGDIPAIGIGLKGTIVALVTVPDPTVMQQLLGKQLDRLP